MTAQMIKETDPQGMGSLELRLAAKALRDSAKQARRGWFDSTAERMIRQRLTQRGMEIAGVAVQHGKGKKRAYRSGSLPGHQELPLVAGKVGILHLSRTNGIGKPGVRRAGTGDAAACSLPGKMR